MHKVGTERIFFFFFGPHQNKWGNFLVKGNLKKKLWCFFGRKFQTAVVFVFKIYRGPVPSGLEIKMPKQRGIYQNPDFFFMCVY